MLSMSDTPVNPPVIIPPAPVPMAGDIIIPDASVLGARRTDGSGVLGARRSLAPAVLGKKRKPGTGDFAMIYWAMSLMASLGGGVATAAGLKKSKKEEDEIL